ncbi:MAG: hypothetical protein ACLFUZ_02940 [Candidatus Micrarchaeia archaeon]
MAQKQAEKEEEGMEQVPVKVEKENDSLLRQFEFELTHVDYSGAGDITKADASIGVGPVRVWLGTGALDLDYYDPLFFVTPRLEIGGEIKDVELYSDASLTIIPEGSETRTMVFRNLAAGAVWEPVSPEETEGFGFRLGLEAKWGAEAETNVGRRTYSFAAAGASFTFEPITFYAKEQVFFRSTKPYEEIGLKRAEPQHDELKAGMVLDLEGLDITAEFLHTPFEKGGGVSFMIEGEYLSPEIYFSGKYREETFGGSEVTGGLVLHFEGKKTRGRGKLEKTLSGMKSGQDWELLYGKKTPEEEKKQEMFEQAIEESENLNEFAAKYRGASVSSKIYAAQRIGKIAWAVQQEMGGDALSLKPEDVVGMDESKTYDAVRTAAAGGLADPGTCVTVHSLIAEFLREAGMEAYAVGFPRKDDSHLVAIAKDPRSGHMYLIDYYDVVEQEGGMLWPLMQQYAQWEGIIINRVEVYGKNNNIIGCYTGPEGKMLDEAAGMREDRMKRALIRKKIPEKK